MNLKGMKHDTNIVIGFAFGLIHGFGFASVLRELNVQREGLLPALVGFNLGVELGQAALVLLTYPSSANFERLPIRVLSRSCCPIASIALGGFWLWERAFA